MFHLRFWKKALALFLITACVFPFFACADTQTTDTAGGTAQIRTDAPSDKTETGKAKTDSTDKTGQKETNSMNDTETTQTEPEEPFPPTAEQLAKMDFSKKNYVIATDQRQTEEQYGAVVLFDLDKATPGSWDLDDAEVWRYTLKPDKPAYNCPSGVKFRTGNRVYGDVVLIACSGGYAGVISFPQGEELWHVDLCGNNPHSIEILPDGAVATASSNGNEVRLYAPQSTEYTSVTVPDAHAVLWDDDNECLWALEGFGVLHAYGVVVKDGKYSLVEIKKYNTKGGAHECTQDFSDRDYLFLCVTEGIVRINKETGAYTMMRSNYGAADCKGYGINELGNYLYISSKAGKQDDSWINDHYASWCTSTICIAYGGSTKTSRFYSKTCAFYKPYVFRGDY